MRKSNKLLLGGFFTVVLLITGIHIALYAKYKNGHYTIYTPEDREGHPAMETFANVSLVTIRDLRGPIIIFGDKAQVEKGKDNLFQYVQKGDSLVITGRNADWELFGNRRVIITLPMNVTLSATNSVLNFEKGKTNSEINPVIYLNSSHALFTAYRNPIQLGHLKVMATDNSIITFHGETKVDNFEVQLSNSSLEYNEGDAGQLSISTDSTSQLSLQSKHLLKAKITTTPSNP